MLRIEITKISNKFKGIINNNAIFKWKKFKISLLLFCKFTY